MLGPRSMRVRFSERDLDFVVENAAPDIQERGKLKQLILEDDSFRRGLLGDERLFQRLMADDETFVGVSPTLYFEVLLRKALSEIEQATHTVERAGSETLVVFDTNEVVELLSRPVVLDYLVDMLASFTRVESYTIPVRARRGTWRRVRFNDIDIDSLMQLCSAVEEERRLAFYKRIADVCLFVIGVFPEHAAPNHRYPFSGESRPRLGRWRRRGLEDYEAEGRHFYKLAGQHPDAKAMHLSEAFWLLHEKLSVAKKPLTFISQHYLQHRRRQLFEDAS